MKRERKAIEVFEPTPHEIRRACENIQQRWSAKERRKRAGRPKRDHWTPPLVCSEWILADMSNRVEDAV